MLPARHAGHFPYMDYFVELFPLLRERPDIATIRTAAARHPAFRVLDAGNGTVEVSRIEGGTELELSIGTTSVYDDPDWSADVARAAGAAWSSSAPVTWQVDIIGRSLDRDGVTLAYDIAVALAGLHDGLVWDAIVEDVTGFDAGAAAARCVKTLDSADAATPRRGLLARLFSR